MKIPSVPTSIDDWSIEKLEELIEYVGIESDTFDFKKKSNQLEEHICAMANTKGGYLILGVEQIDSKDGKKIIRFEKRGFSSGKEDNLKNSITNSVLGVEPNPDVDIILIHQKDNKKFYIVIKIQNNFSDKPYFVRSSDQCFVRIHNSKIRANRSMIFNLFGVSIEQRKNLERLRSACLQTKEDFRFALKDVHSVEPTSTMKIPPYDLTYLRSASMSCEPFLKERKLWGEHTGQSSYTHGINSALHDLNHLKTYIEAYNFAHSDERQSLKSQLSSWSLGSNFEGSVIEMLDKIVKNIEIFFNKQE